jgi:hypothetical protein
MTKTQQPTPDENGNETYDELLLDNIIVTDADVEIGTIKPVRVRKPKPREFFRVHPGEDFTAPMWLLEHEDDMDVETYVVTDQMRPLLADFVKLMQVFTAVNKLGAVFLWTVQLPTDCDKRVRQIAQAKLRAADEAKSKWVQMKWSSPHGAHLTKVAQGDLGEPLWGDLDFQQLIRTAFDGRVINSIDHSIVRELNGEL